MSIGSLISLFDFENRKKIFPAIDSRMKFCLLTLNRAADQSKQIAAEFVFYAQEVPDIRRAEKRFSLTASEIALLNPNTGNCPVFRTQADAELTKAIYRRVPALWYEATDDRTECNPWRISFRTLFHLSNDSHHFRSASQLEADSYRREGNIFVSPYDRYLPLYEAKMLHQFDHRWATYDNDSDSRDVTLEEKRSTSFVGQPRYWVREEIVESVLPHYPEPLALALQLDHRPSIQRVLCYWVAGYHLNRGNSKAADKLLDMAAPFDPDRQVESFFARLGADEGSKQMESDHPLTDQDVQQIAAQLKQPEDLARELVKQHSPKWLIGWRDITNATNERTLLVSALPRVAVGNSYPLLLMPGISPAQRLAFEAIADSLAVDYVARQKVGGVHINYFYLKQFPFLRPDDLNAPAPFATQQRLGEWILPRALELIYTAQDLRPLAADCGYEAAPFQWNDERRFALRCDLDAAMFHLYLRCDRSGGWALASNESAAQLAGVRKHFETPRDAAAYMMEQFPIVRQKDLDTYGQYRTKTRILEIYDAMLASIRSGQPFQSSLNPPPGRLS